MSDYIPADLWPQILLHLPIKTLCICRCVCTTLNSIITSSEFIVSHLSLASAIDAPERRILVVSNYDDCDYSLYPPENLTCTTPRLDLRFPFKTLTDSRYLETMFCFIGMVHGVICLSFCNTRTHNAELILWNPILCKYIRIPTPFTCCSDSGICHGASNFGFGFDAITNDFKIVRSPCTCMPCWENVNPQMTPVFSARHGVWRDVENNEIPDNKVRFLEKRSKFFNGAIHWRRMNRELGTESLLVYDCHLEQFGTMGLPQVYGEPNVMNQILLNDGEPPLISLDVFNGMLAVFGYNWYQWSSYHTCDVWVMKEYGVVNSWTNLFVIELDGGPGRILMDREEDGDEIIISNFGELTSINTTTLEKRGLGIKFERWTNTYVGTFKPSLLLVDAMGSQSYQKYETILF